MRLFLSSLATLAAFTFPATVLAENTVTYPDYVHVGDSVATAALLVGPNPAVTELETQCAEGANCAYEFRFIQGELIYFGSTLADGDWDVFYVPGTSINVPEPDAFFAAVRNALEEQPALLASSGTATVPEDQDLAAALAWTNYQLSVSHENTETAETKATELQAQLANALVAYSMAATLWHEACNDGVADNAASCEALEGFDAYGATLDETIAAIMAAVRAAEAE